LSKHILKVKRRQLWAGFVCPRAGPQTMNHHENTRQKEGRPQIGKKKFPEHVRSLEEVVQAEERRRKERQARKAEKTDVPSGSA
jgi:hypothetical protein